MGNNPVNNMDPTGGEDGDPEPGGMGSGGEEQNGTRPQGAPPVYNAYEGPEISSSYNDDQENRVIGGDEIAGSGAGHMWAGSEGEGITGPGGPGDEKDLNSFFTRLWNKLTGQSNPVPQAAPINIMPNYKGPSVAAPINIIPNYNGPSGNDIEGPNYEFEVMGSRNSEGEGWSIGGTAAYGWGLTFSVGWIHDQKEGAFFYSVGVATGKDLSASAIGFEVNGKNGNTFAIKDFKGTGYAYNAGIGPVATTYFGDGTPKTSTLFKGYGGGIGVGVKVGATLTMTNTDFIGGSIPILNLK